MTRSREFKLLGTFILIGRRNLERASRVVTTNIAAMERFLCLPASI